MIRSSAYRWVPLALAVSIAIFFSPRPVQGQSLALQGTSVTLTLTAGVPGGGLTPVFDARSKIRFKQANVTSKITVQTVCPGQKFGLTVEGVSTGSGSPAPVVTLLDGMLPTDLVTNIGAGGRKFFSCTLQYTATASFAQGNSIELGDDIHTVTYTLVAQ